MKLEAEVELQHPHHRSESDLSHEHETKKNIEKRTKGKPTLLFMRSCVRVEENGNQFLQSVCEELGV